MLVLVGEASPLHSVGSEPARWGSKGLNELWGLGTKPVLWGVGSQEDSMSRRGAGVEETEPRFLLYGAGLGGRC